MNEYLFLITNNPAEKAGWNKEKHLEFVKKCEKYIDKLISNSQLISAQPLSKQGAVISMQNGELKESAFGSDQEMHVGYYLIATTDLEKAIQLAKQNPEFEYCKSAKIEVREIKIKEAINGFVYPKAYSLSHTELKSPVLKKTIEINKGAKEVWSALTDSEKIKKYFFGTECTSDWKKGSAISYKGIWQGKPYEDKGNILDIQEGKFIYYNYWSGFSGLEDKPENYRNIRYELDDKNGKTLFTVTQDGFVDQRTYDHSSENWEVVMKGLKEMVEKEA
jgi:uncharacterized protein YndB with AHSA1/START domain